MKKLIAIAMVLAVASLANASVFWADADGNRIDSVSVNVGETIVVFLASDSDQPYNDLWCGAEENGSAEIVAGEILPNAGGSASLTLHACDDGWQKCTADYEAGQAPTQAGNQFAFSITGIADLDQVSEGVDWVLCSDYRGDAGDGSTLNVDVVPEPITLALLGLGGLALRSRKA